MVNIMPDIINMDGKKGITDFHIKRGEGEPVSNFNVNYFPCDGAEDDNLEEGSLVNLYLSDVKHTSEGGNIFKGVMDTVTMIENREGIAYNIQGRDLAAVLSYQLYTLYGKLSPPSSKSGPVLKSLGGGGTHGDIVDLWDEIYSIMQDTPLDTVKTSLPEGGEMQFHATEWWSYRTDAAETVGEGENAVTYEQGQWHTNRKERIVVTPEEMTKYAALDDIMNAISIGTHMGKYRWCVDNGGALVIFRVDKPEHIVNFDITMDCVSEIQVTGDSTSVTNRCKGYGHNTVVKTTEPASTKRIECDIRDQASIDRFWQRDAPTVDNPDLTQDELNLTCQNSIAPQSKRSIQVTLEDYSNISIATAVRLPGSGKASGKTFTVTDYEISGRAGEGCTTIINGDEWGKTVSKPSPYQKVQTVAQREAAKLYGIPVTVLETDETARLTKVVPNSGRMNPQWIRYFKIGGQS